jgi:pilus assembly protein TadC
MVRTWVATTGFGSTVPTVSVRPMLTAAALAGLAFLIWPVRNGTSARMDRILGPSADPPPETPAAQGIRPGWLRAAAIVAGIAVAAALGSLPGVAIGIAVAVGLDRLLRRLEPPEMRSERLARERELSATLDLLAVTLRAGMPIDAAIELAADASAGPLTDDLRHIASSTRLGAGAIASWAPYAGDTVWGPVARAVRRSATSGSALAATFERVAQERRTARAQRAEAAAKRASVLAMAPLGLCFLPAFICIGVIPVVVGLLSGALQH